MISSMIYNAKPTQLPEVHRPPAQGAFDFRRKPRNLQDGKYDRLQNPPDAKNIALMLSCCACIRGISWQERYGMLLINMLWFI
jgi:hypothetical protein